MRYSTLASFFRHLDQAAKDHLPPVYAIFCHDCFERAYLAKRVLQRICPSSTRVDSLVALKTLWNEPSFFASSKTFWLDATKLGKKERPVLESLLQNSSSRLIVSAQEDHLGTFFEEKGVLLTFFPEKKWNREKRFSLYLQERAKEFGKVLAQNALPELFARSKDDLRQLFSDLDQVCAYVGERKVVEKKDITIALAPICPTTLWQKAEKFVWEKQVASIDKSEYTLFFHAVRKEFQMGYLLASFSDPYEAKPLFPKLWPALFAKRVAVVSKIGQAYFRRGIVQTFLAEKLFRETGLFDPILLHAHVTSVTEHSL